MSLIKSFVHQPDDPGEPDLRSALFGQYFDHEPVPYTRDTLRVIRRNAPNIPRDKLAEAMGWTLTRLERVAKEQNIELKPPSVRASDVA